MKSITNGSDYLRVSDEVAEQKVRTGKFKYISKSIYKSAVFSKPQEKEVKEEIQVKKNDKLERRLKLKVKQK